MEVGIHQDYYMASQIEVGIKVAPLFSTVAGGGGIHCSYINIPCCTPFNAGDIRQTTW